ncbi:MFS transporter small subunit [Marisediminicola senii]
MKARLAIAWALVGIPLAYGVTMTLIRVTALFSG